VCCWSYLCTTKVHKLKEVHIRQILDLHAFEVFRKLNDAKTAWFGLPLDLVLEAIAASNN
jgi:hypothetical protein